MADNRPKNFKRAVLNQKITKLVEGRRFLHITLSNGQTIMINPNHLFDGDGNRFSFNGIKSDMKEE